VVYVGTREENLVPCLDIVAEQIDAVAAGEVKEEEIERAKENLKGRIMLSMEMTSNRMSRLGKSLITDSELLSLDRIIAEIEAVDIAAMAGLAELLLARDQISAAAIGPSEDRVLSAVERVAPGLVSAAAA
jgi:predicted Zn-dependent peptidase